MRLAAAHHTTNFTGVANGYRTLIGPYTLRQPGAHSTGMERMDSVEAMEQFVRMVERKRVEGVGPLTDRLPVAHNFALSPVRQHWRPLEGSVLGELRKRIEKCRRFGNVTRSGIGYDAELAGSDGASFELFREPKHTDIDIELAKSQLRQDRDVVSLSVTKVSGEELAAPIPPDPV